jgi:hypothetical protein
MAFKYYQYQKLALRSNLILGKLMIGCVRSLDPNLLVLAALGQFIKF